MSGGGVVEIGGALVSVYVKLLFIHPSPLSALPAPGTATEVATDSAAEPGRTMQAKPVSDVHI